MNTMPPAPPAGPQQPIGPSALMRIRSLLARVVVIALMAGAGAAGWVAVDRFELELPFARGSSSLAATLPELGDGLPASRLKSPEPWRQFGLTYQDGAKVESFAFDLDSWQLTATSTGEVPGDDIEIAGDIGYVRYEGTDEWTEQSVQDTRNLASFLMSGIGPFVLTDLVPPNVLGFTTLELEGTSRGERVYEVAVDTPTLKALHPLAYQRWVTTTRIVDASAEVYRIRVRPDGYVIRIDGLNRSVQWDQLPDGVQFSSPLESVLVVESPVVPDPAIEPGAAPLPVDPAPPTPGPESTTVSPTPPADPALDPAVDPAGVEPPPATD